MESKLTTLDQIKTLPNWRRLQPILKKQGLIIEGNDVYLCPSLTQAFGTQHDELFTVLDLFDYKTELVKPVITFFSQLFGYNVEMEENVIGLRIEDLRRLYSSCRDDFEERAKAMLKERYDTLFPKPQPVTEAEPEVTVEAVPEPMEAIFTIRNNYNTTLEVNPDASFQKLNFIREKKETKIKMKPLPPLTLPKVETVVIPTISPVKPVAPPTVAVELEIPVLPTLASLPGLREPTPPERLDLPAIKLPSPENIIVTQTAVLPPMIDIPGFEKGKKLDVETKTPIPVSTLPEGFTIKVPTFKPKRFVAPPPKPATEAVEVKVTQAAPAPVVSDIIVGVAKSINVDRLRKEKVKEKEGEEKPYTLEEIKNFARGLQVKVSGTKAELIDRILLKLKSVLSE